MEIPFDKAKALLQASQVIALPTDTVYGLAAPLNSPQAIEHLFQIKGRPTKKPLTIHLSDPSQVVPFTKTLPKDFHTLAKNFWPGPLTLVIPIDPDTIPKTVRASLPTAGFRIPNHPQTLKLIKEVGPLLIPSANLSGEPAATTPQQIEEAFGADFPLLKGQPPHHGIASTILCHENNRWHLLRHGAIPKEDFIPVLGYTPE